MTAQSGRDAVIVAAVRTPVGKGKPVANVSGQKLLIDWVHIWSKKA